MFEQLMEALFIRKFLWIFMIISLVTPLWTNTKLMKIMRRGLRLGDAKIVWVGESNLSEALITWNTEHYKNKTSLKALTPEEWLKNHET